MFKRIALVTLLAATTAITGCANSDVYSGDVYTKDRAKQVQTVSYGTILSTRPVKIQADENSLIGTIGGGLQSLFGGNISLFTQLAETARTEALDLMVRHAEEMGANAVIAMRYDANEITDGITEMLAYGTAVIVEKTDA